MSLVLRHKSGFPVSLHSRLFRLPAFEQSATDLTQSRRSLQILGQSLDVLTPPAALLHLCGHAVTTGSHISPTWASDLWFLVNHDPNRVWREPQWSSLLISSIGKSAAPLALATLTALRYLKENLDITVPAPVCQALESAYGSSGEVDKAAWSAALLCAEGRPRELLRFGNGWSYRAAALRHLLAPPASILRREAGDNQSLASLYVQRFRRFLSASALG